METSDPMRRLRVAQRLADLRAAEAARLAPVPAAVPASVPASVPVTAPAAAPPEAGGPPAPVEPDDLEAGRTWQGQESAARRIAAMLRTGGGRGLTN